MTTTQPGLAHKPKPLGFLPGVMWHIGAYLVHTSRIEYKRAIISLLEYNPNASLLDLGCLDGELTSEVTLKIGTNSVLGIDIRLFSFPFNLCLHDLNKTIPVKSDSFDVVLASHIIEHLNETDTFVKEIYRVLKGKGYAIISTDNLASWHNMFYLLAGKQPETFPASSKLFSSYSENAHQKILTMDGLIQLVKYYNFTVEKVIGTGFYPLPPVLSRIACKLDRYHSVNTTIKVRKS